MPRGEVVHRHRGCTRITSSEDGDRGLGRLHALVHVSAQADHRGEPREGGRTGELVPLGECDRTAEVRLGGLGVEVRRPVSGEQEKAHEPGLDVVMLLTSGPDELERPAVVVDVDLCVVLEPLSGCLFDPRGRSQVLLGAGRARDLLIGDVTDQRVPEGELLLPLNRGDPDRAPGVRALGPGLLG